MQVVGYTFNADTWCQNCLPVEENSEEVGAIFGIDEWDYDVHCNACHELLLEGYIKQCAICHRDLKESQHVVKDWEGDLMHAVCWVDTIPSDVRDIHAYKEENIVQEQESYRGF